MSRLLPLLVAVGLVLSAASAFGQAPQIQTQISARSVEVGNTFQLTLTAMSSSDTSPSNPRLPQIPGVTISGPSLRSQQQVVMRGGSIERTQGVSAVWNLVARQVGKIRVGPPSIQVGNQTYQGEAVIVKVVPQGQAPSPSPGRRRDPFDPFDMLRGRGSPFPGSLFGDPEPQSDVPDFPSEYTIDSVPDPIAFLRSIVSPKEGVVGEQLTLTIYAYGGRGAFREVQSNEPQAPDFLSFPIIENSYGQDRYRVTLGDSSFIATKARQVALFPIKSGDLTLGRMKFGFDGRGYNTQRSRQGLTRQSELLTVHVTEPPLAGRPAGYRIGDVGRYKLSARVEPRGTRYGDSISVVAVLSGTGNLPLKLQVPELKGVQFSDPTLSEDLELDQGLVSGSRRFSYVVKLNTSGAVDLGEITLPYYDPRAKRYAVASAKLGTVTVQGGPDKLQEQQNSALPKGIADRFSARTSLGPAPGSEPPLSDQPWFLKLLLGGPLLAAAFAVSGGVARRVTRALAGWRFRQRDEAAVALATARRLARRSDFQGATRELERAIFCSIEAKSSIKPRGLLRDELKRSLTGLGITSALADSAIGILEEIEAGRFAGSRNEESVTELWQRTEEVVKALSRSAWKGTDAQ